MVLHKLNGIFPLPIPPKLNSRSKQSYGLSGWWPTVSSPLSALSDLRERSLKQNTFVAQLRGSVPTQIISPTVGMYLSLTAASSQYLEVNNNTLLNPSNLSVSCWMKTTTVGSVQMLIARDHATTGRVFQLRVGATGLIQFLCWNVTTNANATGTTTITDGNWHLVIGTWDGINIKVYVDGKLEGTTAHTGPLISTGTCNMMFGSRTGAATPDYYNGFIADPRFYGIALDAATCYQMYDSPTRWELFDVGIPHLKPRAPVLNLAAFNFSGSSTFTVASISILIGELALSGNATVTIGVLKTLFGDMGFSGNSIVTFDSLKTLLASLSLSGNSIVTVDAIKTLLASLTLEGNATVTLNAKLEATGILNSIGDAQSTFSPVAAFVGGFNLVGNALVTVESIIVVLIGTQDPNRLLIVEYEQNQMRTYSLEVENDTVLSAVVEY